MKALTHFFIITAMFAGLAAQASDPVGVYAKIDRVVFLPSDSAPETVKVYGTFAVANLANFHYDAPKRGYMYFKLVPGSEALCRNEWLDFRKIAGTSSCAAFGARRTTGGGAAFNGTVRTDGRGRAGSADLYPLAGGLFKVDADHYLCKDLH